MATLEQVQAAILRAANTPASPELLAGALGGIYEKLESVYRRYDEVVAQAIQAQTAIGRHIGSVRAMRVEIENAIARALAQRGSDPNLLYRNALLGAQMMGLVYDEVVDGYTLKPVQIIDPIRLLGNSRPIVRVDAPAGTADLAGDPLALFEPSTDTGVRITLRSPVRADWVHAVDPMVPPNLGAGAPIRISVGTVLPIIANEMVVRAAHPIRVLELDYRSDRNDEMHVAPNMNLPWSDPTGGTIPTQYVAELGRDVLVFSPTGANYAGQPTYAPPNYPPVAVPSDLTPHEYIYRIEVLCRALNGPVQMTIQMDSGDLSHPYRFVDLVEVAETDEFRPIVLYMALPSGTTTGVALHPWIAVQAEDADAVLQVARLSVTPYLYRQFVDTSFAQGHLVAVASQRPSAIWQAVLETPRYQNSGNEVRYEIDLRRLHFRHVQRVPEAVIVTPEYRQEDHIPQYVGISVAGDYLGGSTFSVASDSSFQRRSAELPLTGAAGEMRVRFLPLLPDEAPDLLDPSRDVTVPVMAGTLRLEGGSREYRLPYIPYCSPSWIRGLERLFGYYDPNLNPLVASRTMSSLVASLGRDLLLPARNPLGDLYWSVVLSYPTGSVTAAPKIVPTDQYFGWVVDMAPSSDAQANVIVQRAMGYDADPPIFSLFGFDLAGNQQTHNITASYFLSGAGDRIGNSSFYGSSYWVTVYLSGDTVVLPNPNNSPDHAAETPWWAITSYSYERAPHVGLYVGRLNDSNYAAIYSEPFDLLTDQIRIDLQLRTQTPNDVVFRVRLAVFDDASGMQLADPTQMYPVASLWDAAYQQPSRIQLVSDPGSTVQNTATIYPGMGTYYRLTATSADVTGHFVISNAYIGKYARLVIEAFSVRTGGSKPERCYLWLRQLKMYGQSPVQIFAGSNNLVLARFSHTAAGTGSVDHGACALDLAEEASVVVRKVTFPTLRLIGTNVSESSALPAYLKVWLTLSNGRSVSGSYVTGDFAYNAGQQTVTLTNATWQFANVDAPARAILISYTGFVVHDAATELLAVPAASGVFALPVEREIHSDPIMATVQFSADGGVALPASTHSVWLSVLVPDTAVVPAESWMVSLNNRDPVAVMGSFGGSLSVLGRVTASVDGVETAMQEFLLRVPVSGDNTIHRLSVTARFTPPSAGVAPAGLFVSPLIYAARDVDVLHPIQVVIHSPFGELVPDPLGRLRTRLVETVREDRLQLATETRLDEYAESLALGQLTQRLEVDTPVYMTQFAPILRDRNGVADIRVFVFDASTGTAVREVGASEMRVDAERGLVQVLFDLKADQYLVASYRFEVQSVDQLTKFEGIARNLLMTRNRTDYRGGAVPELKGPRFSSLARIGYPVMEYYHEGTRLVLAQEVPPPVDGNYGLDVYYHYVPITPSVMVTIRRDDQNRIPVIRRLVVAL